MTKAREWANRFKAAIEAEGDVDLNKVIAEFCEETCKLIQQRAGDSIKQSLKTAPAAIVGAIREQRQKWAAICRIYPRLPADTIDKVFDIISEEIIPLEQEYNAQLKRKIS